MPTVSAGTRNTLSQGKTKMILAVKIHVSNHPFRK